MAIDPDTARAAFAASTDFTVGLEEEFAQVTDRMNDPAVLSDQRALRELGRRRKELEPIVQAYRAYRSALDDLAVAKELGMRDEAEEAEATASRIAATFSAAVTAA